MPSSPRKPRKKGRLRVGHAILIVVLCMAVIALGWCGYRLANPLALKSDTYRVQINSNYDPKGNIASVFMDSDANVSFSGDVNIAEEGSYPVSYTYKGKEYPFTIEVGDFLGPVLKVHDITTDTAETLTANSFIDEMTDDSSCSVKVEGSIPSEPGTYELTLVARDVQGNETTEKVMLTRQEDKTAPVLEGFEEQVSLLQGRSYTPGNYALSDDLDGAPILYVDSSAVDVNTPGDYQVIYNVKDRSGNEQNYIQTVSIKEDPDLGKKLVYLTFDDGPSANTLRVLDTLKQNGAVGTFFVTGTHPDYNYVMKEITDSGNAIALHTNTHDYSQIYSSDEAYFADLQAISDLVEQQTGVKSDLIRFPGGSSNTISANFTPGIMSRLSEEVHKRGYEYFDWNIDSTDASGNDVPVSQIVANATSGIGMDQVVILMHDTDAKNTTIEALPEIIKAYKDAGYEFRVLTKDSAAMHHGINN